MQRDRSCEHSTNKANCLSCSPHRKCPCGKWRQQCKVHNPKLTVKKSFVATAHITNKKSVNA